jgi:hypothetical protein
MDAMPSYKRIGLNDGKWIICSANLDVQKPMPTSTFAIDTETQTYFDGKILDQKTLFKKIKNLSNDEKRRRITNVTWAWQVYDEVNGFFMTNDFETWLNYQCRCRYKFGWCYNSTFDFAQIDYQILAIGKDKWKPHQHAEYGQAYNKGQPYTYESLHNDMGARYAYKLWFPYKNESSHTYCHAIEYHDFMKLITGGLANLLEDMDVKDNEGNPIRKLKMEYQSVNTDAINEDEIRYCENDVKGLYFAIKQFNEIIESETNGEQSIFGFKTNVMTAGGLAKKELLRSLYPDVNPHFRIRRFKKQHPLSLIQDKFLRENHLYRGGISYVNEVYQGRMITERLMYRFDVNSEYPFSMASIRDLVGHPFKMKYEDYQKMENKEDYECVLCLEQVQGIVKRNHLGMWYDPFRNEFVDVIDEDGLHLMFKREFDEMMNWYDDISFKCENVILWKRGGYIFKDFVTKYYELKDMAKKSKNPTLKAFAKLILNSSYGKLAERLERGKGHYELNEATGAIHFVHEGVEESDSTSMNVAIGALVTSFARCYILSKIREICSPNIKANFVYIDTDSIHCFCNYDKADAYALGGLKLEATCEAIKYIAPKTYIDIEKVQPNGTVRFEDRDGKIKADFEIHCKGVNVKAIMEDIKKKQKGKFKGLPSIELLNRKMAYGAKYICLVAMNVRGGKVLLPTEKYLATEELRPANVDDQVIYTNYGQSMFMEI